MAAVEVNKLYEAALAVRRGEQKVSTLPETIRPAVRQLLGYRENSLREFTLQRDAGRARPKQFAKMRKARAS